MGARCDDDHALEEIREEGDDLVRLKLTPHFHCCRAIEERACALAHRLFKRDRNMGSTDFLTEDGDAEKIIAELNQLARGGASCGTQFCIMQRNADWGVCVGTSPRPAAPSASKEPISVRLAQVRPRSCLGCLPLPR